MNYHNPIAKLFRVGTITTLKKVLFTPQSRIYFSYHKKFPNTPQTYKRKEKTSTINYTQSEGT